jgi:hypothetical protein
MHDHLTPTDSVRRTQKSVVVSFSCLVQRQPPLQDQLARRAVKPAG